MSQNNCRNVEIKAKLANKSELDEKMKIASELIGKESVSLIQRDVFFNALNGRLKLRFENDDTAKLIHYQRGDIEGPKLSNFDVLEVKDGKLLEKMLSNSIGKEQLIASYFVFFNA
jgi:adenylate cyclase class IV